MTPKGIFIVLLASIAFLGSWAMAGDCSGTWKWVDDTGKTRYSSTVPEYAKATATYLESKQTQWTEEYNAKVNRDRVDRIKVEQAARERENRRLAVVAARQAEIDETREALEKQERKYHREMDKAMAAVDDARSATDKFNAGMKVKRLRKQQLAEYGIAEKSQPSKSNPSSHGSAIINGEWDTRGRHYTPAGGGNAWRDDGTFMQKAAGGYIDTKTGEHISN